MGIIWPFDSVGQAICPNVVAYLRDRTQSYTSALVMVFVLAMVGALRGFAVANQEGRGAKQASSNVTGVCRAGARMQDAPRRQGIHLLSSRPAGAWR